MSLSPWVASLERVVNVVAEFANITSDDVVYDLGCGDARVLISIAEATDCKRAVGVEIEAAWVKKARRRVEKAGMADVVEIQLADCLDADLSEATVVYLFMTDAAVQALQPTLLKKLRTGCRVVCCMSCFDESWPPSKTRDIEGLGPMGKLRMYEVKKK